MSDPKEPTREMSDAEVKAAIAADASMGARLEKRKSVSEALRAVALIMATEGGRANAAWLELANALAVQLGEQQHEPVTPPELAPPSVVLPSGGMPALAAPSVGIGRRATGPSQLSGPPSSIGGRVTATGTKTRTS